MVLRWSCYIKVPLVDSSSIIPILLIRFYFPRACILHPIINVLGPRFFVTDVFPLDTYGQQRGLWSVGRDGGGDLTLVSPRVFRYSSGGAVFRSLLDRPRSSARSPGSDSSGKSRRIGSDLVPDGIPSSGTYTYVRNYTYRRIRTYVRTYCRHAEKWRRKVPVNRDEKNRKRRSNYINFLEPPSRKE